MAVDLAPDLLEILACPSCHGALAVDHEQDELACLAADCGLAYPVRDQIPILLIDEARRTDQTRTDQTRTDQTRTDQTRTDQTRTDQTRTNQAE